MIREVEYNGIIIKYNLTYKQVKNINLRIKSDLSIEVSANKRVNVKYIDNFVISKGGLIIKSLKKFSNITTTKLIPLYTLDEFDNIINNTFFKVYNLFVSYNIEKPTLKMRKMTSCWGTCNYNKNIITLNKNLIYCTREQIFYVVVHEFAHLLVHNHSKDFYNIVEKYCSNYKEIKKQLNKIYIK